VVVKTASVVFGLTNVAVIPETFGKSRTIKATIVIGVLGALGARLADAAQLFGVLVAVAVGRARRGWVRHDLEQRVALGRRQGELLVGRAQLLLDERQLRQFLGRRRTLALLPRAQLVDPGQQRAPALVGGEQGVEALGGTLARERIGGLQGLSAEPPKARVTMIGSRWDTACTALRQFLARNQISYDWMTPDAPEVAARIAPWRQFAADALGGVLSGTPFSAVIEPDVAAHAVVALYLGLEMLAHIDGDRTAALALFARARELATVSPLTFSMVLLKSEHPEYETAARTLCKVLQGSLVITDPDRLGVELLIRWARGIETAQKAVETPAPGGPAIRTPTTPPKRRRKGDRRMGG